MRTFILFSSVIIAGILCHSESAQAFPDDPLYPANQYSLQIMNVPAAWQYSMGSPTVKIGVLDTGIVLGTPELQGRFLTPINALDPNTPEGSATNNHDPRAMVIGSEHAGGFRDQ